MCLYRKKLFLCGHNSGPHVELCRSGIITSTVCQPLDEDPDPRKSHFNCFECIRGEARAEIQANFNAEHEKKIAENREKQELVRQQARERAERDRIIDEQKKVEVEKEKERARKEGGLWLDVGNNRKGKGRKGGGSGGPSPQARSPKLQSPKLQSPKLQSPKLQSPKLHSLKVLGNVTNGSAGGTTGTGADTGKGGVDPGGRAGVWGPKKILSRDEKFDPSWKK